MDSVSSGQFFRNPDENSGKKLKEFQKRVEDKYRVEFSDFWEFHKWTIDHLTEFWSELWDFSGVIASKKYDKVLDLDVPMDEAPEWFQGARLNFAENLLKYRDEKVALILAGEVTEKEKITYAEMYEEVRLYAAAFRKFGIRKGDIVACYTPNRKEPLFAWLAISSIGGIWASALPVLGSQAVLCRFEQLKPRILLTVDKFRYFGKEIEIFQNVKEISEGLPSLEKVIMIPATRGLKTKDFESEIRNSCILDDFLELGKGKDGTVAPLEFEQLSFSHPIFVNYTSGTTGKPKAIIHGCGALLSMFRDTSLHLDAIRETVMINFSPPGWVSWHIMNTFLFLGATVVAIEGVPYLLNPTYLWDLVDEFKISTMTLTSTVIQEMEKKGYIPSKENQLSSLKTLLISGSFVKRQSYHFVDRKVKKGIFISSVYGSTEFMGACLTCDRSLPVHIGEINALGLGVDIRTVDEKGNPIISEMGELVVFKPMPNLPLGLWNDSDGTLYKETYFSKYPGKFAMSDYAIINPYTRGTTIFCRTDETLKQRGCRFGSSEIYNALDKFPEIRDSLCVAQYNKSMEERAVLFLQMNDGYTFNQRLVSDVRKAITSELTERHVPDIILETKDIPFNVNGKKMEIIVKNIINNKPYKGDTLKNPQCLMYFMNIPELKGF